MDTGENVIYNYFRKSDASLDSLAAAKAMKLLSGWDYL